MLRYIPGSWAKSGRLFNGGQTKTRSILKCYARLPREKWKNGPRSSTPPCLTKAHSALCEISFASANTDTQLEDGMHLGGCC